MLNILIEANKFYNGTSIIYINGNAVYSTSNVGWNIFNCSSVSAKFTLDESLYKRLLNTEEDHDSTMEYWSHAICNNERIKCPYTNKLLN